LDKKKHHITGIILSAGLSGRMNTFKPLLKLNNGQTFLESITAKLAKVCNEIIIVTGFRSDDIAKDISELDERKKIKIVVNKNYTHGMFSSLQTGLTESQTKWYLYHFVDQPSLPLNFYSKFVQQIDKKFNWIQPTHNNKKGHPILFDDYVKRLILRSSENKTLRDVAKDKLIKKKYWECDTELIFQDIDTETEYLDLFDH